MRVSAKLSFIILLVILALVPAFTACSSSTTTATTGTAATTAATTPVSTSGSTPAKQVLIRMTTPVPVGDPFAVKLQQGFDQFNAQTNGAYKMQLYPGAQLVPMPGSLDAIRTGAVEGGVIPPAAFAGEVPQLGLPELPFLYASPQANAYAETALQGYEDGLLKANANQRSLGAIYVGLANLLSKKPIHTLDDLKGMIVGCDTPSETDMMKALGASGIVVNFTEDYSNLQKGVFDAKTSDPQYIIQAKLYDVAKNYSVFWGAGSVYSININSDIYNKMPPDVQNMLNQDMSQLAASISQWYVTSWNDLINQLEQNGVQVYYLTDAERANWYNLVYPGTLAQLNKYGDNGAQIKQIASDANTKYPYTSQQ